MRKNDGGSAFPFDPYGNQDRGMSLRDWFAGQVLAGEMASQLPESDWPLNSTDKLAERCYEFADAMIKEREKPTSN